MRAVLLAIALMFFGCDYTPGDEVCDHIFDECGEYVLYYELQKMDRDTCADILGPDIKEAHVGCMLSKGCEQYAWLDCFWTVK